VTSKWICAPGQFGGSVFMTGFVDGRTMRHSLGTLMDLGLQDPFIKKFPRAVALSAMAPALIAGNTFAADSKDFDAVLGLPGHAGHDLCRGICKQIYAT